MEMQPLKPLTEGIVLIVGTKSSNFDDSLRNHPRVVMWESQQQHWTDKSFPSNTRAIFITRFISHSAFNSIIAEARKRHITIFNPMGTGVIARQVKELLTLTPTPEPTTKEEPMVTETKKHHVSSKLHVLHSFIDQTKSVTENGDLLLVKAKEFGITTTAASLRQMVTMLKRKGKITLVNQRPSRAPRRSDNVVKKEWHPFIKSDDVSVQMLDDVIKGLTDIRQYLIDTAEENRTLRNRVEKLKSFLSGEK